MNTVDRYDICAWSYVNCKLQGNYEPISQKICLIDRNLELKEIKNYKS